VRVEHECRRQGALNLLAAFDTRSSKVCTCTTERKRQVEVIAFLEQLDREVPADKMTSNRSDPFGLPGGSAGRNAGE